ncbi:MAG: cytochrome C [Sulfurifustis sp.]
MRTFRNLIVVPVFAVMAASAAPALAAQAKAPADGSVARGKYLVTIGGCNDCHTPGYPEKGGNVPEEQWLIGDQLGWRGPWGTTYAANLRLRVQEMSEDQWVTLARTAELRPPMPWFNLRRMTEPDLRAVYRYIRHMGPAGQRAPAYVPPDQQPKGPYVQFPAPPK